MNGAPACPETVARPFTSWHHLRHRTSGNTTWIELHLVFSDDITLQEAHDRDHRILEGANVKKDLDEFA